MESKDKKRISKESFRRSLRIFQYVLPYRGKFLLGLLFLFLSSVTFMTFPGLLGRLIGGNEASDSPIDRFFNVDNIDQVALLLLVAFLLQAVFSFMRIFLFADVTERAIAQLRIDTYGHMIKLPMAFFNRERVGELNSRISNDISMLQDTFMTTLAELFRQVIVILGGVSLLFFYSVELTLVMLISVPVMMMAAFFFGKFIRTLSKTTQAELARSQVVVEETLTAIQSVKAFANELLEIRRYNNVVEEVRKVAMRGAKWRGAFASFIIFGLFGAVVLVIWYGVKLRNEGVIGLDELTSFILYSVFVGGSIGGVADIFGRVQKAIGATESLFDIMEEDAEQISTDANAPSIDLKGSIDFEQVTFSYPSRKDKVVLDKLELHVKAGEKIAFVGPSGAGKTTIAALILRYYKATSGTIKFDGKPALDYNISSLRNEMALVPQDVILFGGSIRENIEYGRPGAPLEEVRIAAEKANALEFIESFPEGFATLVGERGVQLSGGQRQRIAIARAILKDPRILILDEATSSLDAESERLVQEALERLMEGRTSLVIAHRLSTIRKVDRIMVLDHGSIKEQGSHEELIALKNGIYRNLTELQLLDLN
ncbi:MAG: ATP-binding cassette domain-containing protein [Flavobacteriales bacterium]|nr:ATP-binding cassette domain-containing protein [Flavobacteriales bacterium]